MTRTLMILLMNFPWLRVVAKLLAVVIVALVICTVIVGIVMVSCYPHVFRLR
jgi:hypothetical protein